MNYDYEKRTFRTILATFNNCIQTKKMNDRYIYIKGEKERERDRKKETNKKADELLVLLSRYKEFGKKERANESTYY